MARRLRFHQPFTTYHVMLRGNDKQQIFYSDEDRYRMCHLIQDGVERFGHSVQAFCFMLNHIHLAIQVAEIPLSHIMQNLAFRYTQYINKKYDRVGHLFQGRFKSVVVDQEGYLLELIRYIHLNPVRAKLVERPEEFVWSSHNAYLRRNEIVWLNFESVLQRFGDSKTNSLESYQKFIYQEINSEPELNFKSGSSKGILGDESFVERFLVNAQVSQDKELELSHLAHAVCSRCEVSIQDLCKAGKSYKENYARALLALLVREQRGVSLESLATFLGRSASSLSQQASRLELKLKESSDLRNEIEGLRAQLES